MAAEGPGRGELAQLMTDHVFGDVNRHMLAAVMNPNDHPHGGGEGKSPIGRPGPVTPWGKPALGYKTRKKKNKSNQYIVRRRTTGK